MSRRENKNDYDKEIFDMLFADAKIENKRKAVRYIRADITTSFSKHGLLNFAKKIPVKLLDISSKGAAIECDKNLKIKNKLTLELVFKDNHSFILHATIIHQVKNKKQYGLKFDNFNDELGDYILFSQNDLLFK